MGQTTEYIDLRARDHTRKGVESAKKNFAGLQKQVKAARASMAGIAAVAAVAGLAKLTKNTLDAADAVEKLSRRTGASARFLSEMQFGLSQSGITSEKFADALKDMNKNAIDAAKGTGMQAEAMQRLGVDSKAFLKLNTDQKFITLAEAISKMEDPAMRSNTAMALFGESGQQLQTILEGGAAGIQTYREEAERMGLSMSENQVQGAAAANDAIDKLSKSITGAITQSILPYTDNIARAADFTREYLPKAIEFLINIFRGMKVFVAGVTKVFTDWLLTIISVGENLPKVGEHFKKAGDVLRSVNRSMTTQIEDNIAAMRGQTDASEANAEAQQTAADIAARQYTPAIIDTSAALKAQREITEKNTESVKESAAAKQEAAKRERERLAELERYNRATGQEYLKTTDEINRALDEAKLKQANYARGLETIRQVLDERGLIRGTKEYDDALEQLGYRHEQTAEIVEEQTGILAQSWEDASSSIFSSLEQFWKDGLDGWDSFADSIKNTVKDMVASILAQITRLIASNAFNKFLSFISGGKLGSDKGLFDGLGQLLGGSSGSNPAADAVKDAAPDAVKSIFNSGFGATIKKGATAAWSTITKGASAVWGGVKTAATWLSTGAKTLIAAIPGWGQAALAAVAVFAGLRKIFGGGARSFSEIVEEDYKPDLVGVKAGQAAGNNTAVFGANWGISGTGITSQHLVDGGENGNGGFFHGAKQNLEEFAELLRQNGLEAKMAGGLLRVLSRDGSKTTADIKRLWQEYANGLTSAVEYSAVFKTAIEENHLKPTNLFFEQFALGFGQSYFEARDAMEKIRVETQKMVASGIDQTKAFTKAFTDFYGIAESDAMRFFNETGISIDKMAEQFATMSADALQALTEFNDDGVTQLEQLVKGAETAATGVRDAFTGVLNGVDLGTPRDTVVTSQVNATETGAYLGAYNRGGSFIVPGNGNSDQPYRIDLTPGERVTVEPDTLTSKAIPTDGGEELIDAVYMLVEQLASSDRNTQRMTALARGQKQNDRI